MHQEHLVDRTTTPRARVSAPEMWVPDCTSNDDVLDYYGCCPDAHCHYNRNNDMVATMRQIILDSGVID